MSPIRLLILLTSIIVKMACPLNAQVFFSSGLGTAYRMPTYEKNRQGFQNTQRSVVRPSVKYDFCLGFERKRHQFLLGYGELWLRTFEKVDHYYSSPQPFTESVEYRVTNKLNSVFLGYNHKLDSKNVEVWLSSKLNLGIHNGVLQPPVGSVAVPINGGNSYGNLEHYVRQYFSLSLGVEANKTLYTNRLCGYFYCNLNYQLPQIFEWEDVYYKSGRYYYLEHKDYNLLYLHAGLGLRFYFAKRRSNTNL